LRKAGGPGDNKRLILSIGFAIRLGAISAFVGMLGAALPDLACAQAEQLSLEIEPGAPSWLLPCLSEATLNARYRAAREPGASSAPLAVQVRVVSQTAAREATLEIRAVNAERSLGARALPVRAQDCSAVAEAVALVLVLLSRHAAAEPPPSAAEAQPPPAPAPPPPPPAAEPVSPAVPPDAPRPPTPEPSPMRVHAAAGALLMLGMLPRAAFGLSLGAELVLGAPSLRLRAWLLLPQTENVAEGGVRFSAYELAFDACLGTRVADNPRFELQICAGPRAGIMHATGHGFELENYQPVDPTLYLGIGPEANLGLTDWALLQLGVGAAIGLYRPRYVVSLQDSGVQLEVAEPSLVRMELQLSLLLIF
jgi:hypothetical protein